MWNNKEKGGTIGFDAVKAKDLGGNTTLTYFIILSRDKGPLSRSIYYYGTFTPTA